MKQWRALLVFDGFNFERHQALRRLILNGVAFVLADQRARDRRGHRDEILLDIGLIIADDLIRDRCIVFFVVKRDGGAENNSLTGIERLRINDLKRRNLAFELSDAAFNVALLFAGGIVLGVFRKVAFLASFRNCGHNGWPGRLLEVVKLRLELLSACGGNRDSIQHVELQT